MLYKCSFFPHFPSPRPFSFSYKYGGGGYGKKKKVKSELWKFFDISKNYKYYFSKVYVQYIQNIYKIS